MIKISKKFLFKAGVAMTLSSLIAGTASAAAFQLWEENGAGVGDYHAGAAAEANDASTGFYNPAGLTRIKNPQVVVGAALIDTNFTFKGSEIIELNGTAVQTESGRAHGGNFNAIPNFHFSTPLTKRLFFGFGITTPFGLETNWGDNSVVRYSATKSAIQTINLNPNFAYLISDNFSFGAGVDYQYLHGEFDQAVLQPVSQANFLSTNTGMDWALGWNAGVLFQRDQSGLYGTRVGLSYRSQIVHHLQGSSTMVNQATGQTVNRSGDVKADVTLPGTSTLSAFQQLGQKWSVMGTAMFTRWTSITALTLRNVAGVPNLTPSKMDDSVYFGYNNSWNFALGAHYQMTREFMLRFGTGYDLTPTNRNRDIRLPDENRFVLAIGGQYKLNQKLSFDLGLAHFFVAKAKVKKTILVASTGGLNDDATTDGNVTGYANVVGLQMTWNI